MRDRFRSFLAAHTRAAAFALLAGLCSAASPVASAQASDPPARVAALTDVEGSAVFAPAGETEWADAARNRPITRGDRVWVDAGSRAELHVGYAAIEMDGRTFLELVQLDDDGLRARLNEGAVDVRLRLLDPGEGFEIGTPQVVARAGQPAGFRIDVDTKAGVTRIAVRSGTLAVQAASGSSTTLVAGQQASFGSRALAQSAAPSQAEDAFDRWASLRHRAEEASASARFLPRDVVGYHELDSGGTWASDPAYGMVWFPDTSAMPDWAPYRYGRWEWIEPWGWTWIDEASWAFAPSHYGRWASINSRWAWVPGRIGTRPVYSPALVMFAGGGPATWAGGRPGIAWYPLAPGEIWRPYFRASPAYVRNVNRSAVFTSAFNANAVFAHRQAANAITAVRAEDFDRGPVQAHWLRLQPAEIERLPATTAADLPRPHQGADAAIKPAPLATQRTQGVMNAFEVKPAQPRTRAPE